MTGRAREVQSGRVVKIETKWKERVKAWTEDNNIDYQANWEKPYRNLLKVMDIRKLKLIIAIAEKLIEGKENEK